MLTIGYLGPEGTFTEEASRRYFANQDVNLKPYGTILDVLLAVNEKEIDQGVVPIENSLEGSVTMTLDGLARFKDLFVEAEIVLAIEQNLLVTTSDISVGDITEVWSHPQAIAQCREFIHELGAKVRLTDSTAAAAAEVAAAGRPEVAAIGPAIAAEHFNLVVLQSGLQDQDENYTRFVVVGPGMKEKPQTEKSILLISLDEDRPGALVHVLNLFAVVGLNLSRIESRPTRKKLGTYQFYIDVEAGLQDDAMRRALAMIEIAGHGVRVLGSYAHKR